MFDSDYLHNQDMSTFIRSLGSSDQAKVADAAGLYIAEKLRERSFARQILTPRIITAADCQRDVDHDQLYVLDEKEVATAPCMAINFKAEPDNAYITTPRYKIPIQEISTLKYSKKEIELLASSQPVIKILEDNLVREIERVEDTKFLQYADAAMALATGGTNDVTYAGGSGVLTKGALKALRNRIERNALNCSVLLMSRLTWNDLVSQEFNDVGSPLQSEVFVNGYKHTTLQGMKVIVSIKEDLFTWNLKNAAAIAAGSASEHTNSGGVPARYVYAFTDEKALGRFISLDTLKFAMRKKWNSIEFMGWEYIGMGFGNSNGIARVELWND